MLLQQELGSFQLDECKEVRLYRALLKEIFDTHMLHSISAEVWDNMDTSYFA